MQSLVLFYHPWISVGLNLTLIYILIILDFVIIHKEILWKKKPLWCLVHQKGLIALKWRLSRAIISSFVSVVQDITTRLLLSLLSPFFFIHPLHFSYKPPPSTPPYQPTFSYEPPACSPCIESIWIVLRNSATLYRTHLCRLGPTGTHKHYWPYTWRTHHTYLIIRISLPNPMSILLSN